MNPYRNAPGTRHLFVSNSYIDLEEVVGVSYGRDNGYIRYRHGEVDSVTKDRCGVRI